MPTKNTQPQENQVEVKHCPVCEDGIEPDHSGDYFCMDCQQCFLAKPINNVPAGKWVKFKM